MGFILSMNSMGLKLWQKHSGFPSLNSWKNVQRRQDIFLAGTSEIDQTEWVISMGHLMGLLDQDWLGMRATRKLAFLRYADFYCVQEGQLVRGAFSVT